MDKDAYIVYRNIHELIKYRGYNPDPVKINSALELEREFQKTDPIVISGHDGGAISRSIRVFLVSSKDVLSKTKLPSIIAANSGVADDIIIVFNKKMQVSYHNAMLAAEKIRTGRKIWYMQYANLVAIIPEHCYNGEARILTADEKTEVSKLNRIIPSCFMYIREYDVLALWLGAVAEDVIEVKGASDTAGVSLAYRYVIPQERYSTK